MIQKKFFFCSFSVYLSFYFNSKEDMTEFLKAFFSNCNLVVFLNFTSRFLEADAVFFVFQKKLAYQITSFFLAYNEKNFFLVLLYIQKKPF